MALAAQIWLKCASAPVRLRFASRSKPRSELHRRPVRETWRSRTRFLRSLALTSRTRWNMRVVPFRTTTSASTRCSRRTCTPAPVASAPVISGTRAFISCLICISSLHCLSRPLHDYDDYMGMHWLRVLDSLVHLVLLLAPRRPTLQALDRPPGRAPQGTHRVRRAVTLTTTQETTSTTDCCTPVGHTRNSCN